MNKIYELVFYWEDIYDGCEITETILTTSCERVEAEIEDFRNSNLKNGGEESKLEPPVHKGKSVTINGITYNSLKHASQSLGITIYKVKKLLC